jgi:hypothetical protein
MQEHQTTVAAALMEQLIKEGPEGMATSSCWTAGIARRPWPRRSGPSRAVAVPGPGDPGRMALAAQKAWVGAVT